MIKKIESVEAIEMLDMMSQSKAIVADSRESESILGSPEKAMARVDGQAALFHLNPGFLSVPLRVVIVGRSYGYIKVYAHHIRTKEWFDISGALRAELVETFHPISDPVTGIVTGLIDLLFGQGEFADKKK